ncbi:MAG: bifunctional precorrin-2 dehydrogenase/sirohydrochlorin ferrochelatase [Thermodesulfobacteriota bacterium]
MKYYPINININGIRCVVVGGGPVGERKVKGLVECGASVTVISPTLTAWLESLAKTGAIEHVDREYRAGDLQGAFLVFAATGEGALNTRIAEHSRSLGILVDVATSTGDSIFTTPSVLRRGDVMITASTGGSSPALSKHLRQELERTIGEEYEMAAEVLGALRIAVKAASPEDWECIYKQIPIAEIISLLRSGDYTGVEERIKTAVGIDLKGLGVFPGKSAE